MPPPAQDLLLRYAERVITADGETHTAELEMLATIWDAIAAEVVG